VSRAGPVYMHRYFHCAQICVLFLLCFLSHKHTKFQELEVRQHVESVAVCLWKFQEIDKNLCSFFSMLCYLVTDSALTVLCFLS